MTRAWVVPLLAWCALSACEKPCKPGYGKVGLKCVMRPVPDAGGPVDASEGEGPSGASNDAGRPINNEGSDGGNHGGAPDAGSPLSPECMADADCGDLERLHCVDQKCIEHECYAGNPCADADVCEMHVCVPFTPPERFPSGFVQTNGGGTVTSAEHRLRWSAGMPQPFGITASNKHRLILGPGAAP